MLASWPMSALMSLAVMIVLAIVLLLAVVVGRFSEKWGNRIGCFGLLVMLQGAIMVWMLWSKEP